MLTFLCIENFAIVSRLELDFNGGMTAFTGETGAGKSIMIDALLLVMGGRSDSSVIRPGTEKCEIHAKFTFDENSEPAQWLATHDLATDELEVWIRRVVTTEGRSKCFINGQPFPTQKIKELSELLVDIHGQHQHQRLLHPTTHRIQLDEYAEHYTLLESVHQAYQKFQELKQQETVLLANAQQSERMELLNYQIEELKSLAIQENEFETLDEEHQLLHHAQTYLMQAEHMRMAFAGNDEHKGLCQQIHSLIQLTQHFPKNHIRIKNISDMLNQALIQCDEAFDEVEQFSQEISVDPERLAEVEQRMSQLHAIARKYHIEPKHLLNHLQSLEKEQQSLQNQTDTLFTLHQALEKAQSLYFEHSKALTLSRQKYAPLLAQSITRTIQQLGIPQGFLEINIQTTHSMQPWGLDKIEYYVCTNPGLKSHPLGKIASGGELSRISLAIHLITAQKKASTPTLIFDEVDVGIGGATAALVGQHLRKLGNHLQVFCVTHQPQVASCAHYHYLVKKHIQENQTFSEIMMLTNNSRTQEIARMLGGLRINEQTLSNAEAMLQENLTH